MFRIMQSAQESSAASHKCRFCVRHFGSVFDWPYKRLGAGRSSVPSQHAREPSVLRSYIGRHDRRYVIAARYRFASCRFVCYRFARRRLSIAFLAICLLSLCSLRALLAARALLVLRSHFA